MTTITTDMILNNPASPAYAVSASRVNLGVVKTSFYHSLLRVCMMVRGTKKKVEQSLLRIASMHAMTGVVWVFQCTRVFAVFLCSRTRCFR